MIEVTLFDLDLEVGTFDYDEVPTVGTIYEGDIEVVAIRRKIADDRYEVDIKYIA